MRHKVEKKEGSSQFYTVLPRFLLLSLLISACGGIVPPPPKKAGTAPEAKPLVLSTVPVDLDVDIAFNLPVSVTFSKAMSAGTLNGTTFLLNDGTGFVSGAVVLTGQTAVFKPTSPLLASTAYTATITQDVQDTFENPLGQPTLNWTFTTAAANTPGSTDNTPPQVIATIPLDGETFVRTNTPISVTFSEAIDPATITVATGNFGVNHGIKASDIVSDDSKTFTFVLDPTRNPELDFDTPYSVTITIGVKDLANNALSAVFIWAFRTEPASTGGEI